MRLLLVFVVLCGSMIFTLQFTQQADNTTDSDKRPEEISNAPNTIHELSTSRGSEEPTKIKKYIRSGGGETRTDSLTSQDVDQKSVTKDTPADLQTVTAATASKMEHVNHSTKSDYDITVSTPQYGSFIPTPQFTNSPVSSAVPLATSSPEDVLVKDSVTITSNNVLRCAYEKEFLRFNNTGGKLSFSQRGFNQSGICYMEFFVPSGMVIQMYVFLNTTPCSDNCFSHQTCTSPLLRLQDIQSIFLKQFFCDPKFQRVVTPRHRVEFHLEVHQSNASIDLSINFTAVPPLQLQIAFITPTTGYVQSPDWDGKINYPSNLDIKKELHVPDNYSVMISFHAMDIKGDYDCMYDQLIIRVTERKVGGKSEELAFCNSKSILKPTVFHTDALDFHFKSDVLGYNLGFRLYFSFHNQSEIPEKLEDGKWNCSVPYWPKFQLHFNCNKIAECDGGEDEDRCGYSDNRCPKGFISVGSSCYAFISREKLITWNEAANECFRHESYLASLNGPKEWKDVLAFIKDIATGPVYFGLQRSGPSFPYLYRDQFQWADRSAAFYANVYNKINRAMTPRCTVRLQGKRFEAKDYLDTVDCNKNMTNSYLCEKNKLERDQPQTKPQDLILHPLQWPKNSDKYVTCPSGHVTLTMLACDPQTACWADQYNMLTTACQYPGKPPPPSLQCTNGVDSVPYTLVCDHRPDCSDNSDESFCVFPSCHTRGMFQCSNKQCVPYPKRCDKIPHCLDGSDEIDCPWYYLKSISTPEPPALIHFFGNGSYEVEPLVIHMNQSNFSKVDVCPETHFLCPGNLTYCMPVYVRCNGVYDCPGREDEDGCDRYQCPGFYRCRASPICVHANHLCDGVFQCPQQDDELLCEATCPQNCSCQGLAFYCRGQFPNERYPELRFLHAPGSELDHRQLKQNSMLVYLNLAHCILKDFDKVKFPNLRILDLSYNKLESFSTTQLTNVDNLQELSLAGNPLKFLFAARQGPFLQFPLLKTLHLSNIAFSELDVTMLTVFPKLMFLNLSACGVWRVIGEGFKPLTFLRSIDLRGCPVTDFPKRIFRDLTNLKKVWTDNYKLCCPVILPKSFHLENCHSPSDEISSCDALLRSDFYRIVLSVFAALALIGNLSSFVYRVFINPASSNLGFGVFVTHLCVSDFLMGVYLAVIGIADRMYQGNYLWKDDEWKQSAGCRVAGFLSLLSSEVSAFLICLITLDRFIVLRFPFSNIHFMKKSAHVACFVAWFIGIVIAGVPLLPVLEFWKFYSQNGICIPLPITRYHHKDFAGHTYSFSIIIIMNFILFLLIAAGQIFIYWSICTNRMSAGDCNKKSKDLVIARRLITIAMSDFLCWFPIGLLGLLAANGMSIPGEVNVAMAIVALPINSAINPFLYTINSLLEKRRKAEEQRLQKMMMSSFASKNTESAAGHLDDSYTQREALQLIKKWLSQNLVSPQHVEKAVLDAHDN